MSGSARPNHQVHGISDITASGERTADPRLSANVQGVLWMLAAGLSLTGMFAVAKHLTQDLPVLEVSLFRFFGALVFYLPWFARHRLEGLRTRRIGGIFVRAFFGTVSLLCMMYAVAHLYLADATVLGFTIPLWNIVTAAILLNERIRIRRTLATIVGFIGVVVIVQPQGGVAPAAIVAISGALLASLALVTMKRLTSTEPSDRIVFYFLLFGSLTLALPAAAVWQAPSIQEWLWIALLGLLGSAGQMFLTRGYAAGEVTIVAPMDFLRVIFAGIIGFFVFGELPELATFIGSAIVIGACIYIVRREATIRRAPKA